MSGCDILFPFLRFGLLHIFIKLSASLIHKILRGIWDCYVVYSSCNVSGHTKQTYFRIVFRVCPLCHEAAGTDAVRRKRSVGK